MNKIITYINKRLIILMEYGRNNGLQPEKDKHTHKGWIDDECSHLFFRGIS